jgi:hypothetical protein
MQAPVRLQLVVRLPVEIEVVEIRFEVIGSSEREVEQSPRAPHGPQLWLPYPGWERDVLRCPPSE